MNREIKFRAWSVKDKCMIDWGTIKQSAFNYGEVHLVHSVLTSNDEIYHVMQFSGMYDKCNKPIYEGDLLHVDYNRFGIVKVYFEKGRYNICNYNLDKCEVVGNIYDNPELLKP